MAAAVGVSETGASSSAGPGMDSEEPLSEGSGSTDQQGDEGELPPHLDGGGQTADKPSVELMREEIDVLKMVRWLCRVLQ